jgi:hypothetical protein
LNKSWAKDSKAGLTGSERQEGRECGLLLRGHEKASFEKARGKLMGKTQA